MSAEQSATESVHPPAVIEPISDEEFQSRVKRYKDLLSELNIQVALIRPHITSDRIKSHEDFLLLGPIYAK